MNDLGGSSVVQTQHAPLVLTDATAAAAIQEHRYLVVDAWAPWCGPCRAMAPILDELAREMAGAVTIAKLNVDENPAFPRTYGVSGIPTLVVFRDHEYLGSIVGLAPKDALKNVLMEHAPRAGIQ